MNANHKLLINLGLLISGVVMTFSGLTIQFGYHMGHHGGIDAMHQVLGLDYYNWTSIHKVSILVVSFLMIFHVQLHWKFYKVLMKRNVARRNRQVIILSVLFFIVAILGFVPWLIHLTGGPEDVRKSWIEIHDKITLLLFPFLFLHLLKRWKWYFRIRTNS